jgi:protein-tyrosine phosphatase
MNFRLQNRLIVLLLAIRGRVGRILMGRPKPIIFPKDVPVSERLANRRIAFAGAYNFRDLGGYTTVDGFTTKWGTLYRADNLSRMTGSDLKYFDALNLSCLIDFRSDFEKAMEPDRLPVKPAFRVVELPIFDSNSKLGQELRWRILHGNMNGIDPIVLLTEAYVEFVAEFMPQFRAFIQEVLAAQGRPIVFHCTAGKDRTGFASAILLHILGVPWDEIVRDYLLSQLYVLQARTLDISILRFVRGKEIAHIAEGFIKADVAYLQAAFDAIDARYGSFDAYVRDGLELSHEDVRALRLALLEK